MPKQPEVLSTNPTTTEEATQSSQDVTPTQKANIDFSVSRKWKLPTLDENEKSDQKKNIEPKPKQTKLSSFFLKINWIMLNYVSFVVTQIFLFLSGTFSFLVCLYIDICLDQFSFCKVHVKIIENTLRNKINAKICRDIYYVQAIVEFGIQLYLFFIYIKKK